MYVCAVTFWYFCGQAVFAQERGRKERSDMASGVGEWVGQDREGRLWSGGQDSGQGEWVGETSSPHLSHLTLLLHLTIAMHPSVLLYFTSYKELTTTFPSISFYIHTTLTHFTFSSVVCMLYEHEE